MQPKREEPRSAQDSPEKPIGRGNSVLLYVGVALLVMGLAALAMTDAQATNIVGRISPLLFLLACVLVFVGLVLSA